jgi:hypothetical protein
MLRDIRRNTYEVPGCGEFESISEVIYKPLVLSHKSMWRWFFAYWWTQPRMVGLGQSLGYDKQ